MNKKKILIVAAVVLLVMMITKQPEPTPPPPPAPPAPTPPKPPAEADAETQRRINAIKEMVDNTWLENYLTAYERCNLLNEVKNLTNTNLMKLADFYKSQFKTSLYDDLLKIPNGSGCVSSSPIQIIRTRLVSLNKK